MVLDNNSVWTYNYSMMIDKELNMRGSIRAGVGFLMAFGAVGGLDAGNALLPCVLLAAAGLAIMASGVSAMGSK